MHYFFFTNVQALHFCGTAGVIIKKQILNTLLRPFCHLRTGWREIAGYNFLDLNMASIRVIFFLSVSAKYAAVRRKNRDWLARNQVNMSEWSDMSTRRLLLQ